MIVFWGGLVIDLFRVRAVLRVWDDFSAIISQLLLALMSICCREIHKYSVTLGQ